MLSFMLTQKAPSLLCQFDGRKYVDLTDKFTCTEFKDGLDLSKSEFEKICQELYDACYVKIDYQGPRVVLTVTPKGKSVVAGKDPFEIGKEGIRDDLP